MTIWTTITRMTDHDQLYHDHVAPDQNALVQTPLTKRTRRRAKRNKQIRRGKYDGGSTMDNRRQCLRFIKTLRDEASRQPGASDPAATRWKYADSTITSR